MPGTRRARSGDVMLSLTAKPPEGNADRVVAVLPANMNMSTGRSCRGLATIVARRDHAPLFTMLRLRVFGARARGWRVRRAALARRVWLIAIDPMPRESRARETAIGNIFASRGAQYRR